jgi:hypothetical protein
MPRTDTDSFAASTAAFEAVITVRNFARDSVRPVVTRFARNDHADGTIHGLFLRALTWLNTLAELKEPQHFQAAFAGTRALLEILAVLACKLTLLYFDKFDAILEARFRAIEADGKRWSAIAFGQAKGYLAKA